MSTPNEVPSELTITVNLAEFLVINQALSLAASLTGPATAAVGNRFVAKGDETVEQYGADALEEVTIPQMDALEAEGQALIEQWRSEEESSEAPVGEPA